MENFWKLVERTDTCWNWTGTLQKGYGHFTVKGIPIASHRLSYQTLVGLIPDGLDLDHLCFNKACVNPEHLEPVTRSENRLREWARAAGVSLDDHREKGQPYLSKCIYGHERTVRKNGTSYVSVCKTCVKDGLKTGIRDTSKRNALKAWRDEKLAEIKAQRKINS